MTARIYVGTYAKYNDGSIEGAWLDLDDYADKDEFELACQALHGPGEHEFMFQDWEDIPEGMISECHVNAEVWDWLRLSDNDQELLKVYRGHIGQAGTLDEAQDAYRGKYGQKEEYAEEYVAESGDLDAVPKHLRNYIDYKSYAHDMDCDGTSFVYHDGGYWVFV